MDKRGDFKYISITLNCALIYLRARISMKCSVAVSMHNTNLRNEFKCGNEEMMSLININSSELLKVIRIIFNTIENEYASIPQRYSRRETDNWFKNFF